jgi:hypothetical protein
MKCDLCEKDEAATGSLLCLACREAIVRLLVISERELTREKPISRAATQGGLSEAAASL